MLKNNLPTCNLNYLIVFTQCINSGGWARGIISGLQKAWSTNHKRSLLDSWADLD